MIRPLLKADGIAHALRTVAPVRWMCSVQEVMKLRPDIKVGISHSRVFVQLFDGCVAWWHLLCWASICFVVILRITKTLSIMWHRKKSGRRKSKNGKSSLGRPSCGSSPGP